MSLEDSKKEKNYSNVAPLPTKTGIAHHRKLKIKKIINPKSWQKTAPPPKKEG